MIYLNDAKKFVFCFYEIDINQQKYILIVCTLFFFVSNESNNTSKICCCGISWGLCYQSFVGFHATVYIFLHLFISMNLDCDKNFIHLNNPNNIGSNRNKEK